MTLLAVADTANDTARPNLVLIIVCGVLVAAGIYLILERSLTRVLLGAVLASNGVSVLFLVVSGKARGAPAPSRGSVGRGEDGKAAPASGAGGFGVSPPGPPEFRRMTWRLAASNAGGCTAKRKKNELSF